MGANNSTDVIKALEYLVGEITADRLRVVDFHLSAPVREKNKKPFQDFKEFEQTGDIYMELHFQRLMEARTQPREHGANMPQTTG